MFNDIAKDPKGSPSNVNNWDVEHNVTIAIYDEKTDLQASLTALADSLEVSDGLTPYGPVFFGISRCVGMVIAALGRGAR